MKLNNITQAIVFFSLFGPGIVGNVLVIVKHMYTYVLGIEKKPIDLILTHLAFCNIMIICSIVIRDIATVFYFRNFLGDIGCKAVVYLARMARGLSICTTCLLSVVQAVTISPRTTIWTKLKPETAWQVFPCLLLFWTVNTLISSNLLCYIKSGNGLNRSEAETFTGHCYMLPSRNIVKWLFLSLMTLRDVIFQTLMGWSSGFMAFHLYKHHKHVLYLYSSRQLSSRKNSPPEIRATWSVLILMTCFLFFYWADFILSFYTGFTVTHDSLVLSIKTLLELGYASFSPYVLISRDIRVPNVFRAH
ncbi:putative vomeronasal receptor-like protein 4 [Psammomys obesus]|uniref:putative vomeronasal receptor-like protein 4 n=1 Tax=Psammomys obesus TaxID=48139 RepID=UPI002452BE90|nr:putative vomeronasal receptor-like protein 4 [Psammomys obesus]